MIEGLMVYAPNSAKYNLEFGSDYFKLMSTKEIRKAATDVIKIFMVMKTDRVYYIALEFAHNKRHNATDMMIIEVSNKLESKDVILPVYEEERNKLLSLLQVEYDRFYESQESNEFGQRSLLIKKNNGQRLNAVPQFVIVYKMFQYICKNARCYMSDVCQSIYKDQAFRPISKHFNIEDDNGDNRCYIHVYNSKQMQRDYQIYVLDKYIILLPFDAKKIAIADISMYIIENDSKNSTDNHGYARIIIYYRGSSNKLDFVKVDKD